MAAIGIRQPWLSSENKPLLWALLISVVVHALAFWLLFVLAVASILFSHAKREAIAEVLRTQAARARTQPEQPPELVFVQVDPSQAVPEAPKNAKYYSAQNSVAANPGPKADTDTPRIDGLQTHVPKTETTPRSTAMPLQPSSPKDAPTPDKNQESKPEQRPKPGDLAMFKPDNKPAKDASDTPQVGHERPHTLAEAHLLAGDKMKEDGGVKRQRSVHSLDAVGSPFGEYDERIVAAIQERWYTLLDTESFAQNRVGQVVVTFRLYPDGHISDARVIQSDVGDILSYVCVSAINDPAPYDRWPEVMYRKNKIDTGHDYRDCRMVFAYE
jgi:outer membrane biosynthesis protein TonB